MLLYYQKGNKEVGSIKLKLNNQKLKEYLDANGISERELAKRMGVSYVTLYRVLTGRRNPGNEFVARILNACEGLRFEDLFIFVKELPNVNKEGEHRETS